MKHSFKIALAAAGILCFGLSSNVYAGKGDVPYAFGNTGFYIELGGSYSIPSEIESPFTRDTNSSVVSWDTDRAVGVKVQLGWDFGKIRSDLKIAGYESGVDSINEASASRDDFWFGSATLNGYWDIANKKLGKGTTITPYVGAGVGYMGGYIRGTASRSGVIRRDNRVDYGFAGRGMLGAQLSVSRHVGITLGYDVLVGDLKNSTFTDHAVELGLRLTF